MNEKRFTGPALEQALANRLSEELKKVSWLHGWKIKQVGENRDLGYGLLVTVPLSGGANAALCVACKAELRPNTFPLIAARKPVVSGNSSIVVPVLASQSISPRIAELCKEHGWSWFDLAGNHRLDIPGVLHLEHTGNKPVYRRPRPGANLGTTETSRVIRTLLLPGNAGKRWTQRELQVHCIPRVSLGLVNKVIRFLRDEAFIDMAGDGGFRIKDFEKLLSVWCDAYRVDRHERCGYFTLMQEKDLTRALTPLNAGGKGHAAYASFSAADNQAPHVRQPKTWLYLSRSRESDFRILAKAKPVDSGENIVVLFPDDESVFQEPDEGAFGDERLPCTNVIQTYADVYHGGGRGREAAEALLEQRLRPLWKSKGVV